MKHLENYIAEKKELFDNELLPTGHKERFMEKLRKEELKKNGRKNIFAIVTKIILPAAAVFAIAFIIENISGNNSDRDYLSLMEKEEQEVLKLVRNMDTFSGDQIISALENITFEAIPLKDQLPAELPEKCRERILNNYYKQKTEGIREIKQYLTKNKI